MVTVERPIPIVKVLRSTITTSSEDVDDREVLEKTDEGNSGSKVKVSPSVVSTVGDVAAAGKGAVSELPTTIPDGPMTKV